MHLSLSCVIEMITLFNSCMKKNINFTLIFLQINWSTVIFWIKNAPFCFTQHPVTLRLWLYLLVVTTYSLPWPFPSPAGTWSNPVPSRHRRPLSATTLAARATSVLPTRGDAAPPSAGPRPSTRRPRALPSACLTAPRYRLVRGWLP